MTNQHAILRRYAEGDGDGRVEAEDFVADCVEVGKAVYVVGANG